MVAHHDAKGADEGVLSTDATDESYIRVEVPTTTTTTITSAPADKEGGTHAEAPSPATPPAPPAPPAFTTGGFAYPLAFADGANGEHYRFSKAKDTRKQVFVTTGKRAELAPCATECSKHVECVGIYLFVTIAGDNATPKCRGMMELGTEEGVVRCSGFLFSFSTEMVDLCSKMRLNRMPGFSPFSSG
jgi:hypothetical protein